KVTSF
ncbi:pyridoxamine 5'-phosphate oxidase family protein, partial [Vibrio parahaemolyticus V-223/04]